MLLVSGFYAQHYLYACYKFQVSFVRSFRSPPWTSTAAVITRRSLPPKRSCISRSCYHETVSASEEFLHCPLMLFRDGLFFRRDPALPAAVISRRSLVMLTSTALSRNTCNNWELGKYTLLEWKVPPIIRSVRVDICRTRRNHGMYN